MAHLAVLENLTGLHLGETGVSTGGLGHLEKMVKLEKLWLHDTPVDDKAVEALSGFRNLKELYVYRTGISKKGLAQIRKALPRCRLLAEAEEL